MQTAPSPPGRNHKSEVGLYGFFEHRLPRSVAHGEDAGIGAFAVKALKLIAPAFRSDLQIPPRGVIIQAGHFLSRDGSKGGGDHRASVWLHVATCHRVVAEINQQIAYFA